MKIKNTKQHDIPEWTFNRTKIGWIDASFQFIRPHGSISHDFSGIKLVGWLFSTTTQGLCLEYAAIGSPDRKKEVEHTEYGTCDMAAGKKKNCFPFVQ